MADFLAFIRQFWKVLNIFFLALYLSSMALNYKDIYMIRNPEFVAKKLDSFPFVKFRLSLFGNCQLGKCHYLFWGLCLIESNNRHKVYYWKNIFYSPINLTLFSSLYKYQFMMFFSWWDNKFLYRLQHLFYLFVHFIFHFYKNTSLKESKQNQNQVLHLMFSNYTEKQKNKIEKIFEK